MSDSAAVPEEERLAVWCAVACAMDVIGEKWHPVIVHRLLQHDALRFNELNNELGAITNEMLSQSPEDLVDREIVSEKPVAVEYSLTDRGQSLRPVIDSLEEWGKAYLRPAESEADAAC